ncbi:NADP-dependent oxidoreductase domain-containing protein [Mycena vitilis]|nr:NADP-dependent oxidoreductase domain-containing protein [Mycena vitilis]
MSQKEYPLYETKGMPFRRLGNTGLRVPLFSLGGWLTLGGSVTGDPVKGTLSSRCKPAVSFIPSESLLVSVSSTQLGYKRTDLIITTKLFWGVRPGPNDGGLSRKHIIEGTQESLERLQMTYVDVIFAHRYDRTVPMEEIVRAFNYVIEKGWAFYWGTSEWSASEIEEAHYIATKLNLIAPVAEQCQHHMFHRERPENPYGYGTMLWSPLASGMLTGKLTSEDSLTMIERVKKLTKVAQSLKSTPSALALAWLAKNSNTSTIILGVSSAAQLVQNLEALKLLPGARTRIWRRSRRVWTTSPRHSYPTYGRPPLDAYWNP